MAEQKIELRKVRDFGENINDAFVFIKQHGGPLVKSFFAVCSIFMLAQAIFNGFYQAHTFSFLDSILKERNQGLHYMSDILGFKYFILIFLVLLTFVSMNVALGAYVKYYVQSGNKPGIQQVWEIFRQYFARVVLYSIPVYLLTIIGLLFCFLPGVYLWVVFLPFPLIVIIEDKSFTQAYQRCFELIKENFWTSFAIYFVAYIIYGFSYIIVGAGVSMIIGIAAYLTTSEIGASLGVVTSFLNLFSFCFYIVFYTCVTLNYFSLVEKKDGTGLMNRINEIGNNVSPATNIEEQY